MKIELEILNDFSGVLKIRMKVKQSLCVFQIIGYVIIILNMALNRKYGSLRDKFGCLEFKHYKIH